MIPVITLHPWTPKPWNVKVSRIWGPQNVHYNPQKVKVMGSHGINLIYQPYISGIFRDPR